MGRLRGAVLSCAVWLPALAVGVAGGEPAGEEPKRVKTAFFGEVETGGIALAVMDGGTHGVPGHTLAVGADGRATWERRLDSLRPAGSAGRGVLQLTEDERRRLETRSQAAWDVAGPSGRATFFLDPASGAPRWVWAVVVRRGDEVRLVEGSALLRLGGPLPEPVRALLQWVADRVDRLSEQAP